MPEMYEYFVTMLECSRDFGYICNVTPQCDLSQLFSLRRSRHV